MSSPVWKFFSVAEEDNAIAICNVCSARILRGGKKASSFNTTNLISHLKGRHRGEAVLTAVKIVCGSIFRFLLAINTQCAVIDMQIILNDILHDL